MSGGQDFSAFANLPLSVLEEIPGLIPPPGVIPDFQHPVNISPLIIGLSSAAIAISTLLFTIRCYNMAVVSRKVRWDDLTCTLGFLFILPEYIGVVWACLDGPLGKHQYEIHLADIISPAYLIGSAYFNVVFVSPMLLFVKITFFLMYLEIFSPFRWMRICCIIGGTLCTLFYVSTMIVQFVFATPRPGESFVLHALNGEVFKTTLLGVPMSIIGLVFDIYLLVLPLIAVAQLNMPLKRKIGTSLLFATGVFAIIGSILGVYFRQVADSSDDAVWGSGPTQIVTVYEGCFGLICVCMPSIAKVAQRHNLVKKANSLFSKFTRLTTRGSLLGSSKSKSGHRTEDDTIALSQSPESVKFVTLNSTIGDYEEQREKNPSYTVHIGANETPESFTPDQQPPHFQPYFAEDAQADRVRRYMNYNNYPNSSIR